MLKNKRLIFRQNQDFHPCLELNKVVNKASLGNLFRLLDDISRSISLAQDPVNMTLLLDNVLIVWSHITHLKQYPIITNLREVS